MPQIIPGHVRTRLEVELAPAPWYRWLVVLALAASVLVTWPLWEVRTLPALLPIAELPQMSVGAPLLLAVLGSLAAPIPGAAAATALIGYGMLLDQTRMQPEFFSLPILLWGATTSPVAKLIARAHLVALWGYAGLHKLLSADYLSDASARWSTVLPFSAPSTLLIVAIVTVAAGEIALAVLSVIPATRRVAAWLALILHGGIVLSLALSPQPNLAVWPWNLVLAASGFALIATWRDTVLTSFTSAPVFARAAVVILLIMPLGFYAGVVDAYPAHQLYSAGTIRPTIYCPAGCRPEQDVNATWHLLRVPLPPETRLYLESFARTCAPGDTLKLLKPRLIFSASDRRPLVRSCPARSFAPAHP